MSTAFLLTIFAFLNVVLWLWIAYRAMRAHERLADAAEDWLDRQRPE